MFRLRGRLISVALAVAVSVVVPFANVKDARAGGYKRVYFGYGYGYHHGRHYRHHRHHHHGHGVYVGVAAAIVGGLVIAQILSQPRYRDLAPVSRVKHVVVPPGLGNCKPTTGVRTMNDGRRALMTGTWCSDRFGRGYILDDTVRFLRYLN